ncbi:hypothetical protein BJX76DRAFT_354927 [Aspergillus varians]
MYNPWSAHTHSHAHHAQAQAQAHAHAHAHTHGQHQGHGHGHNHTAHGQGANVTSVSGTVPGNVSSGTRLDLDSSPSASPSQSSYQMSQMRWLPSMITTRSHNHNASLPTISSNLRMQHPHAAQQQQQQQQAPVSMIVESRGAPANGTIVGAGGAQAAQRQQQVVALESEESDRSESPGGTPGTRDVSGADALGDPEFGGDPGQGRGLVERDGDIDMEGLGENGGSGKGVGNGDMTHAGGLNLTTRKHGKRLTTKEEVSLFEICNRHAAEFGQRSNLCKWWMTVTMEFTRGQKHPYSWHSVRRKVELVTKQRMKFLEEQRDKGASETDDLSNPRWRAVVDTWIPTWQRWEDAEARRIEKRDSRRPRKRKWTITTPTSTTITTDPWDLPTSSAPGSAPDVWRAPSSASSSPMVNHNNTPQNSNHHHTQPAPSATPLSSTPVRLPPGFDTLFSSQTQTPLSAPASTPFNPQRTHQTNHHPSTPGPTNPIPPTPDNTMMAAVLETLGKLNKHLDSNPNSTSLLHHSTSTSSTDPSLSQSQSNTQDSSSGGGEDGGVTMTDDLQLQTPLSSTAFSKLKEDLKVEMLGELRTEWDKERAVLEEKLDSVQRTQEMILEMLRQEPS